MAKKNETATEPTATEPKKDRKPRDVQYRVVRVMTFRAHKSVTNLPDVVPGILAWAEKNGLIAESETITETQKSGKKTKKGQPLAFPKVEVTFDTKESHANRKATSAGMDRETAGALRVLVNDESVIAKAKAQGISVAELINRAVASVK